MDFVIEKSLEELMFVPSSRICPFGDGVDRDGDGVLPALVGGDAGVGAGAVLVDEGEGGVPLAVEVLVHVGGRPDLAAVVVPGMIGTYYFLLIMIIELKGPTN